MGRIGVEQARSAAELGTTFTFDEGDYAVGLHVHHEYRYMEPGGSPIVTTGLFIGNDDDDSPPVQIRLPRLLLDEPTARQFAETLLAAVDQAERIADGLALRSATRNRWSSTPRELRIPAPHAPAVASAAAATPSAGGPCAEPALSTAGGLPKHDRYSSAT
ncbi:hypothetical protein [Micromonospora sp. LOL_023]|uniref:hypothetical protein n=1 Tax=Micromonospora sp. LOL_023 TaxID=3345418 RepID=UPI003A83537A